MRLKQFLNFGANMKETVPTSFCMSIFPAIYPCPS